MYKQKKIRKQNSSDKIVKKIRLREKGLGDVLVKMENYVFSSIFHRTWLCIRRCTSGGYGQQGD